MVFSYFKKNKKIPYNNNWILDFDKLDVISDSIAKQYQKASPFPHVVLEDFIAPYFIDKILEEFPAVNGVVKWHDREAKLENGGQASFLKKDSADFLNLGPMTRQLLWEMNSRPFIKFVSRLTGIRRLISDPLFEGGGVHQTLQGGLLAVHADRRKHKIYKLDRRVNAILYLNKDWSLDFGGNLELWDRGMSKCEIKVEPVAGRCVIFNTDETSFHGHPHPLTCPSNRSRKSLATYYFTNGMDNSPGLPKMDGTTNWKSVPPEG
jgi:hypothetical protein